MPASPTLAQIAERVDHIIATYGAGILHFVNKLTAECPSVIALFDGADADGLQLYKYLGFETEVPPGSVTVMDILQQALDAALVPFGYEPIDELPGYEPGTVLLFVFTMGVVVSRRFEQGDGTVTKLREVKRIRDVEIKTGLTVEGALAIEVLVNRSAATLRQLRDPGGDWVGLIARSPHGAKVGYIERSVAIRGMRASGAAAATPADQDWYRRMVDELVARPRAGQFGCLIEGWGPMRHVWIAERLMPAEVQRPLEANGEDLLQELIVACRDQRRTLRLLEKCLDKLGEASAASPSLAELVGLVRPTWADCAAIHDQIGVVMHAFMPTSASQAELRLHRALLALAQATIERKRGGALNTRGGSA